MLGGAFNPPHEGHLLLAREAASGLGLDRVLLVPAGRPPHKTIEDD
ncbi:MAG: nicotinate-nicotinamide nucleotide adenylyltransferase, partial [Solirubrobacterales bacterium]